MSKIENHIANILYTEDIHYEREKTFPDLKAGKFRFDFYLPDAQGGRIIEVQGNQHYKNIYNDREKFLTGQEHDRRKISWCLANNIPIYCIPEWDIPKIKSSADIFQEKYRAKTRWHNDEVAAKQEHLK